MSMADEKTPLQQPPQQADERLNELLRLLRTIEERFTNSNRKLEVLESNFLTQQKKMNKDFLLAESDLVEMKKELSGFNYKITLMQKELSLCARKSDVDVLRRYLDFWQPLDFIRRDEAERFIQGKQQIGPK